jgi:hypothetical protein
VWEPVGWWKLDEKEGTEAADSSGSGLTGRVVGDAVWSPEGGKFGGAIEFDGAGDYIDLGNDPRFDFSEAMSISVWVRPKDFDTDGQAVISKGDTWLIARSQGGGQTLEFICNGINGPNPPADKWPGVRSEDGINDGQWHHIVGTYDAADAKLILYIDGKMCMTKDVDGRPIDISHSNLFIGENSRSPGKFWSGLIDDVRLYDFALTAADVNSLYVPEKTKTNLQALLAMVILVVGVGIVFVIRRKR